MSENRENEIKNSDDFVESMLTSARSIIRTCLQIRSFETILIVTDPESSVIGRALYEASAEVTDRTLMMMMPILKLLILVFQRLLVQMNQVSIHLELFHMLLLKYYSRNHMVKKLIYGV